MEEISLNSIDSHLANNPNGFNIIFLNLKEEPACLDFEKKVIENVMPSFSNIKWFKIYVTKPPTFAPPVLPCIILFGGENRIAEAGGVIKHLSDFSKWLEGAINVATSNNDNVGPTSISGDEYV
jgi:hypothetical protein